MPRPSKKLREDGLRVSCKKQPFAPNRASCQSCLDKARDRSRLFHRQRHAERRALKQCVKCAVPVDTGLGHCQACLTKRLAYRDGIAAEKLCVMCRVPVDTGLKYCRDCLILSGHRQKIIDTKIKVEVMNYYGGCHCSCPGCAETALVFLTIDHIHGGGARHRKETGGGGTRFYRWLRDHGFPPGFRVLCFNCNIGFYRLGYCPHCPPEPVTLDLPFPPVPSSN